jgi:hypothetical protein
VRTPMRRIARISSWATIQSLLAASLKSEDHESACVEGGVDQKQELCFEPFMHF